MVAISSQTPSTPSEGTVASLCDSIIKNKKKKRNLHIIYYITIYLAIAYNLK